MCTTIIAYGRLRKGLVSDHNWTVAVDTLFERAGSLGVDALADRTGVSAGTLRRWRRMREAQQRIPEPRGIARSVLLTALDEREGRKHPLSGDADEPRRSAPPPSSGDIAVRLDGIEALPVEERLKILKIAEVSAAYRAAALYEAEVAARIRAEALREAERAGMVRSEVVGKESSSAAARAAALGMKAETGGSTESPEERARALLALLNLSPEVLAAMDRARADTGADQRAAEGA